MAPPIFSGDQIDQSQVSLSQTNPTTNLPVGGTVDPNFWRNYFQNGATAATRPGVSFDTTNADQARGWQQQIMQDLQRQAAGDLNSRAQQSLTQGYTDARQAQSALGSAAHGTGGGAGLRAGVLGAGSVQRGYAGDQKILMTQEQQNAQALLAQQLAQQRTQDAGQAQSTAANAMGNQGLDDAMRQFYMGGGLGMDIAGTQRGVDLGRAQLGINDARQALGDSYGRQAAGAVATGAGAAANFWGGQKQSGGYRQVDGQDSIVPTWDK